MKKRIYRYVKHILATFLVLAIAAVLFGLFHGASFRYAENPAMMNWDKDGPYVFFEDDSTATVNYIRGNQEEGFFFEPTKICPGCRYPSSLLFPIRLYTF